MSPRLVLVRHGETEWSRVGRHTGRTDVPLTPAGEDEARAIGITLHDWIFAAVFASPLRRARHTARLAGFAPTLDDDLVEWDYGAVEGRTNDAVTAQRPGWSKWFDTVPDGEQVADVAARADRFIDRTVDLPDDVLVFGHGHHLAILVARWLELAPVEGRRFPLATATVSILGHKRDDRVVHALNRPCGPPLPRR